MNSDSVYDSHVYITAFTWLELARFYKWPWLSPPWLLIINTIVMKGFRRSLDIYYQSSIFDWFIWQTVNKNFSLIYASYFMSAMTYEKARCCKLIRLLCMVKKTEVNEANVSARESARLWIEQKVTYKMINSLIW